MQAESFLFFMFDYPIFIYKLISMLADKDFHTRVAAGKSKEAQIIDILRDKYKMDIVPANEGEDKHDKIDAWLTINGKKMAVQIKFREEGKTDIIFEIVKDLDKNILGRDLIGKADYYLVVDSFGEGTMIDAALIKSMAEQVRKALMPVFHRKNIWGTQDYQVHITVDKSSGNRKMMMFVNPNKFKAIGKYKFDIR